MIKDKLTEAVRDSLNNIKKGDDHIPLNMRGELEVIVKDRDGNVLSYERGHNQVTNLAKMAIIHLLAGEIGVVDSDVFSIPETSGVDFQRTYALGEATSPFAKITSSFTPTNHTQTDNLDGQLVSGEQFFYVGANYVAERINQLSQITAKDISNDDLKFNFPTKMLFGTGMEASNQDAVALEYRNEIGENLNTATICKLNGYSADTSLPTTFFNGCSYAADVIADSGTKLSNWYSNSKLRCRTLQPATPDALITTPSGSDTSIKGAIKNCFITSTNDSNKYNGENKMAQPDYRGFGYPCFIYAKRSTNNFYVKGDGNHEVHYEMNDALGATPYETELVYTVDMPPQPVNSREVTTFYPYNGWILKQAGLFSDSRFRLRSEDNSTTSEYSEASLLSKTNGNESDDVKSYRDSVGGQMLFTRNLSSPILKTPDNEVTFHWHIFITI